MLDDRIPEEADEEYQQIIALLRQGLSEPQVEPASDQSQILARVREQLMRADDASSEIEEIQVQRQVQTRSQPVVNLPWHRSQITRTLRDLAAVLLVGVLVGAALLMFRSAAHSGATRPPIAATGPSASLSVGGMQASIHVVTPGSYFLGELVTIDVSVTNQTSRPVTLTGSNKPDLFCSSSALRVTISGEGLPTYTLPDIAVSCLQPLYTTTLAPGQTLNLHWLVPVTKSGDVTISMSRMSTSSEAPSVGGHWPSVTIHVSPQIPSYREISLRSQGTQVIVHAPPAAQEHLIYLESISCDQYGSGTRLNWSSLPTPVLSQPACPTPHKHWDYIVSAPGYAIVGGNRES
jgi:hypothetical protein